MELLPLIEGIKDVRMHSGRYRVQLEIPNSSTLTDQEIEKVLALSTWDMDPNQNVDGYEGSRSALIRKYQPIKRGKVSLGGLQISGIGYRDFEYISDKLISIDQDSPYYPPSRENFMARMKGTHMSTSYVEGNSVVITKPEYRALGTYLCPELLTKLKNTLEISELDFELTAVPSVEAYGRYLDPELCNDEGNFGFAVFPIPDVKKLRVLSEIMILVGSKKEGASVLDYHNMMTNNLTPIVRALRELHDKGYVHLQPHLGNIYVVDEFPYIVDWGTMRKLGNDHKENVKNRAIDLYTLAHNYDSGISGAFQLPSDLAHVMNIKILELLIRIYSRKRERINMDYAYERAKKALGRSPLDVEVIELSMKDSGIEGFPIHEFPSSENDQPEQLTFASSFAKSGKIGRNNPCPCGSGRKYKKCCGKC